MKNDPFTHLSFIKKCTKRKRKNSKNKKKNLKKKKFCEFFHEIGVNYTSLHGKCTCDER